ncbi:MAG TPA: hypothetical protein VFN19_01830 [Candidatus Nanopelagicales bacterium]|nr:hypothetical protein [Candidatus Nanopelagicales bacterium]
MAGAVAAVALTGAPAGAAPTPSTTHQVSAVAKRAPLPPRGASKYAGMKIKCYSSPKGYVSIGGAPTVWLYQVPKKRKWKDALVISYFLQITMKVQMQAGYNGTLWKTVAKKKYKQNSYTIPAKKPGPKLPQVVSTPLYWNARNGTGEYRLEMQVKLRRNATGPDTTAWQFTQHSASKSCFTIN